MLNRRNALKKIAGAGLLAMPAAIAVAEKPAARVDVEAGYLNPRTYGAKGDGKTKDTVAIQSAIDDCNKRGGGVVYVSPGTYLVGTILIKSNVNLHLEAGATLLGSADVADYISPPAMVKAVTWTVPRHLIIAMNETCVALTGRGTVDGSNQKWLLPSKNPPTKPEDWWHSTMANTERIVRISPMVEIACCTDVLVEGVTLQNAVGWTLRPISCTRVVIRGVKVRNASNSQNTDGIDPTSCEDVMISDCDIDTGDDALCLKTDNPYNANKVCRNVTVSNCIISSACSGFKVGSEGYFGFENIAFSNSVVWTKAGRREDARVIAAIDVLIPDGGYMEGVTVSNITIRNARIPIWIRLQNRVVHKETPMTAWLRSVSISNVQAFNAGITSGIMGIPGYPVKDVTLHNIRIQSDEPGVAAWSKNDPPEREHGYPEGDLFGRYPVFGLYCRHVDGLSISDMDLVSNTNDPRGMMHFEDVASLSLRNITGTPSTVGKEDLLLINVNGAAIAGNYPTGKSTVFARIEGEKNAEISFFANDLHRAKTAVVVAAGVPTDAVRLDGESLTPGR